LHPSYWPARLLWLARNEPATFGAAARFVSFSDYLGGDARTSVSMASGTGLFDVHRLEWDEELMEAVGVRREQLPEPEGQADEAERAVQRRGRGRPSAHEGPPGQRDGRPPA